MSGYEERDREHDDRDSGSALAGCLISFFMFGACIAIFVLLTGCSAMPSMKYCDKVEYKREGSKITLKAECRAPVGTSLPGM